VIGAALLLALGCAQSAPAQGQEPRADGPQQRDEPSTGAARWQPVRRPSDATVLEHPARVIADPSTIGEIAAPFRARVTRVHVRIGQAVQEGDPVLDVVMPEVLGAAATVRGTTERIEAHRARAEQLERLRAEGIVDAARVFEQRAAVADLEAERASALAVLQAASIDPRHVARLLENGAVTLRAPASGIVQSLDARLGETREPGGEPFARIVGAGGARIEVRSSEMLPRDAAPVFEGADGATVPLASEPISSVVDPSDGTIVTWLAPADETPLVGGLRGRVRLTLAASDLWEVPASAIEIRDQAASVYRRVDSGAERVEVTVVATSGATAIVRGPLREGDVVASRPSALAPPEA
jgi:hypothetical protein